MSTLRVQLRRLNTQQHINTRTECTPEWYVSMTCSCKCGWKQSSSFGTAKFNIYWLCSFICHKNTNFESNHRKIQTEKKNKNKINQSTLNDERACAVLVYTFFTPCVSSVYGLSAKTIGTCQSANSLLLSCYRFFFWTKNLIRWTFNTAW